MTWYWRDAATLANAYEMLETMLKEADLPNATWERRLIKEDRGYFDFTLTFKSEEVHVSLPGIDLSTWKKAIRPPTIVIGPTWCWTWPLVISELERHLRPPVKIDPSSHDR